MVLEEQCPPRPPTSYILADGLVLGALHVVAGTHHCHNLALCVFALKWPC